MALDVELYFFNELRWKIAWRPFRNYSKTPELAMIQGGIISAPATLEIPILIFRIDCFANNV